MNIYNTLVLEKLRTNGAYVQNHAHKRPSKTQRAFGRISLRRKGGFLYKEYKQYRSHQRCKSSTYLKGRGNRPGAMLQNTKN
jgi:hypothetical protein